MSVPLVSSKKHRQAQVLRAPEALEIFKCSPREIIPLIKHI
jgi:hypothetical protein